MAGGPRYSQHTDHGGAQARREILGVSGLLHVTGVDRGVAPRPEKAGARDDDAQDFDCRCEVLEVWQVPRTFRMAITAITSTATHLAVQ